MSLACQRDGVLGKDIKKKGVLLNRRDNCDYMRKVYSDIIMMIFNKKDFDDIIYHVIQEINKLCSRFYGKEYFVITKSIGDIGDLVPEEGVTDEGKKCWKVGDYKLRKILPVDPKERQKILSKEGVNAKEYYLSQLGGQVQLAERMRKRGQLVAAGSRIEYVITTNGGHKAKQCVKIESYDYFKRHSSVLEIDYMLYLKQMTNPFDQILNIIIKNSGNNKSMKNFVESQYKYRLRVRQKVIEEIKSLTKHIIHFEGVKKGKK